MDRFSYSAKDFREIKGECGDRPWLREVKVKQLLILQPGLTWDCEMALINNEVSLE